MLFANIHTEEDIEKLKKRIVKDVALAARLKVFRSELSYTKSGEVRGEKEDSDASIQMPTKAEVLALYKALVAEGSEVANPDVEMALRKIKTKSNSGVAVVSLLTKP